MTSFEKAVVKGCAQLVHAVEIHGRTCKESPCLIRINVLAFVCHCMDFRPSDFQLLEQRLRDYHVACKAPCRGDQEFKGGGDQCRLT